MPVIFQGPHAGFDPLAAGAFNGIPDEPGVYIVGVKISVDVDGKNIAKFCPLYVGETNNLRRRISDHHDPNHANARLEDSLLNFTKELFDITLDVSMLYHSIKQWNFAHWNFSVNLPKVFGFSPSTRYAKKKKEGEKGNMYRAINGAVALLPLPPKPLINFNCPTFFDSFLGSFNISNYRENSGHQGAIDDLNRIIANAASSDIIVTRAITLRDKIISNSASNLKSLPHGFSGDESKYSSG